VDAGWEVTPPLKISLQHTCMLPLCGTSQCACIQMKRALKRKPSTHSNRLGKRKGTQRNGPASSKGFMLHRLDLFPCFASTLPAQASINKHTVKLNPFSYTDTLLRYLHPSPHRQTHQDYPYVGTTSTKYIMSSAGGGVYGNHGAGAGAGGGEAGLGLGAGTGGGMARSEVMGVTYLCGGTS